MNSDRALLWRMAGEVAAGNERFFLQRDLFGRCVELVERESAF